MMPVLPFIEDNEDNIAAIVARAARQRRRLHPARLWHDLRDRQRAYYYEQLDRLFPGLRQRYEAAYGERYSCASPNAKRLAALHQELCLRYGIADKMPHYAPPLATQPRLL